MKHPLFLALTLLSALPAWADFPVIEGGAELRGSTLHVTLSHPPDTGWEHYTDGWEVRTPDGGVELGLRVLAHPPHVQEQPFTRSLSVDVPDGGVEALHIRARCNRDGWGGDQVFVLPLD